MARWRRFETSAHRFSPPTPATSFSTSIEPSIWAVTWVRPWAGSSAPTKATDARSSSEWEAGSKAASSFSIGITRKAPRAISQKASRSGPIQGCTTASGGRRPLGSTGFGSAAFSISSRTRFAQRSASLSSPCFDICRRRRTTCCESSPSASGAGTSPTRSSTARTWPGFTLSGRKSRWCSPALPRSQPSKSRATHSASTTFTTRPSTTSTAARRKSSVFGSCADAWATRRSKSSASATRAVAKTTAGPSISPASSTSTARHRSRRSYRATRRFWRSTPRRCSPGTSVTQRAAGHKHYLDPRRKKLAPMRTKLELTREDLERRLGRLLERVNSLASAPGQISGDIAYRLRHAPRSLDDASPRLSQCNWGTRKTRHGVPSNGSRCRGCLRGGGVGLGAWFGLTTPPAHPHP